MGNVSLLLASLLMGSAGTPHHDNGLRVVLVPMINISTEKWEELKAREVNRGNSYLQEQFYKRGFSLVPADETLGAIKDANYDFSSDEKPRFPEMEDLGMRLHADYVLLAMITFTDQAEHLRPLYKEVDGRSDVKIWLVDVQAHRALLNAKKVSGKSGGDRIILNNKGSDHQIQAVENALRDGLASFFKRWPEVPAPLPPGS